MDFDWQKYLSLAEKIKNQVSPLPENALTEALKRTAVSRAYYAVFHIAEDFAIANLSYQRDESRNAHNYLRICYMSQSGNSNYQQVKPLLAKMHKYRKECDYQKSLSSDVDIMLDSMIIDAQEIKRLLAI